MHISCALEKIEDIPGAWTTLRCTGYGRVAPNVLSWRKDNSHLNIDNKNYEIRAQNKSSQLLKLITSIASHSISHVRTTDTKKGSAIRYGISWILMDSNGFEWNRMHSGGFELIIASRSKSWQIIAAIASHRKSSQLLRIIATHSNYCKVYQRLRVITNPSNDGKS